MATQDVGAIGAAEGTDLVQSDPNQTKQDDLSNADVKSNPLFLKVTKELAELRRAEEERAAAQDREQRDAALKLAQEEKRYEDALKLHREDADRELSELRNKALFAEIKATLLSKGAKASDGFYKVAMAEYDPEKHTSLDALADYLKTSEMYSQFFVSNQRAPLVPPSGQPVSSAMNANWDEVKTWETSNDKTLRAKARTLLREYREQNGGKYPY